MSSTTPPPTQARVEYYNTHPFNSFASHDGKRAVMDKISDISQHGYVRIDVHEVTRKSAFPSHSQQTGGAFKNITEFSSLLRVLHDDMTSDEITFQVTDESVTTQYETRGCHTVRTTFTAPSPLTELHREQAVEALTKEFSDITRVRSVEYEQPRVQYEAPSDYETVRFEITLTHTEQGHGWNTFAGIEYHLNQAVAPIRGVLTRFEDVCIDTVEAVRTPTKRTGKRNYGYKNATVVVKVSMA